MQQDVCTQESSSSGMETVDEQEFKLEENFDIYC